MHNNLSVNHDSHFEDELSFQSIFFGAVVIYEKQSCGHNFSVSVDWLQHETLGGDSWQIDGKGMFWPSKSLIREFKVAIWQWGTLFTGISTWITSTLLILKGQSVQKQL